MVYRSPLPADVDEEIATLGQALGASPEVVFAYVFGGRGAGDPTPLSEVDVAVYLAEGADPLERIVAKVTAHLGTDEVDVVVLNNAPTALLGVP